MAGPQGIVVVQEESLQEAMEARLEERVADPGRRALAARVARAAVEASRQGEAEDVEAAVLAVLREALSSGGEAGAGEGAAPASEPGDGGEG